MIRLYLASLADAALEVACGVALVAIASVPTARQRRIDELVGDGRREIDFCLDEVLEEWSR